MRIKENDIHGSFKIICELYIKENDFYGASKIYAPYNEYTIDLLLKVTSNENNKYYLDKAKNNLIESLNKKYYSDDGALIWFDKEELIEYIEEINYREVQKRDKQAKEKLYYISIVAFIICIYSPKIIIGEERQLSVESIKENFEEPNIYYRGQNNSKWRISPSILRNLNRNIILDDNSYYVFLKEDESESKFDSLMRDRSTNTYDKYAFMQHSRSFSPFVDFTTNMTIATSFALSNVHDANCFRNEDSVVFQLIVISLDKEVISDRKEAKNFLKSKFKLIVINKDYFVLGRDYLIENSDGTTMIYNIVEFSELVSELTPKFKILKIATNDRMKYQKGLFLCFYDCLCLNSFVFYELNSSIQLRRLIIKKGTKRKILKEIYKERKYDPEHLMDPYLYFKE